MASENFDFFIQNNDYEENQHCHDDDVTAEIENVSVKQEIDVPPTHDVYIYKCRICAKMFESLYAFTCHVNKHKKRCQKCRLVFKTWKQLEDHDEFCARRFGRSVIPARPKRTVHKTLPFKCQLCSRKYETREHLFQHQFRRCSKRYLSPAWIVKI